MSETSPYSPEQKPPEGRLAAFRGKVVGWLSRSPEDRFTQSGAANRLLPPTGFDRQGRVLAGPTPVDLNAVEDGTGVYRPALQAALEEQRLGASLDPNSLKAATDEELRGKLQIPGTDRVDRTVLAELISREEEVDAATGDAALAGTETRGSKQAPLIDHVPNFGQAGETSTRADETTQPRTFYPDQTGGTDGTGQGGRFGMGVVPVEQRHVGPQGIRQAAVNSPGVENLGGGFYRTR